jgi:hypothetical protein
MHVGFELHTTELNPLCNRRSETNILSRMKFENSVEVEVGVASCGTERPVPEKRFSFVFSPRALIKSCR